MKILVLSSAFERPYLNARLRLQCDYLTEQGHHVEVYTEPWDRLAFKRDYSIEELGERNTNYFKWLILSIYSLFTNYKERKFAYLVLWRTRKAKFDLVFCSTNSCFPLGAAAMVAKMKNIPLHVDLWDLQELMPTYIKYTWWHFFKALRQHLYTKRRNAALAQAQSITTVSPEHVEAIKAINPKVELLYNGFDPQTFSYKQTHTDTFRINYFGLAYSTQNIDMILHVMEKFRNELPKAQWMFYSNDLNYNHFRHSRPNICGTLPAEAMPEILDQASIVLLFNDTDDNGLCSDQFYQALGAEKPVLFTNTNEGAVPKMIELTDLGLATNSLKACMDYIRQYYAQWEKDGYTHREVKNKDLFNAKLLAERLEQILLCLK